MQSRKDQVQAYFFVVGRLAAAVTHGKPDVLQPPNRRLTSGIVLGVLLACVLAGIFGIYGVFKPGGDTSWRQAGAIVMDEDSGARYVYLDGQLRPVLNYSSARLVTGQRGTGQIVSVARNSLAGTPVGQPIGIPGAPDALPAAGGLDTGPWTVCTGPSGPTVTLLLGQAEGTVAGPGQALIVAGPDGAGWLVWQGRRHRLGERSTLETLGYGDVRPVQVATGWLNPVPQGPDIAVPPTPGAGEPGPVIEGKQSYVGQVYEVRNPAIKTDQLYLVRQDGIAPLSRTGAALLLAAPSTTDAYPDSPVQPVEVGPAALAGVPTARGVDLVSGLPAEPPQVVVPPPDTVPCVRYGPSASGELTATAELLPAGQVTAAAVPVGTHVADTTADKVVIPAGTGVLAREQPAPGATPGTAYLITEVGMRFPLADESVLAALGYSESSVVRVPAELLRLLPTGPLLSTQGALRVPAAQP
jgi:type VII secretion protein EccB